MMIRYHLVIINIHNRTRRMRAKRRTRVRMTGKMTGRKMKARMRMARKEKKRVKLRWRIRDSKYLPSQSPVQCCLSHLYIIVKSVTLTLTQV